MFRTHTFIGSQESVHLRTVVNVKKKMKKKKQDFVSIKHVQGHPKLSLRVRVDSSSHSMALCVWRPKSNTQFKGRPAFPLWTCAVWDAGSGRGKHWYKLGWGALQGRGWGDDPVYYLGISPFFKMSCRCQGASLVSS